ncbi:MAG: hypothetical protein LBH00_10695 [Planctomycetaceae bacterium]|nr:hypothetical protein [Planctomycetaceae bacterium]
MFFPRQYCLFFALVILTAVDLCRGDEAPAPVPLRYLFRNGNNIASPNQNITLDIEPVPGGITPHAVLAACGKPVPPQVLTLFSQSNPSVSGAFFLSFAAPEKEGLYEIIISGNAAAAPALLPPLRRPPRTEYARIPFAVIAPKINARTTGDPSLLPKNELLNSHDSRRSLLPFPKVAELPRITDFPKPSHLLRLPAFGERKEPEPEQPVISGLDPGKPYLLEFDCPSDDPQEIFQDKNADRTTAQYLFWAAAAEMPLPEFLAAADRNLRLSEILPASPADRRLPKLFEGISLRKRTAYINSTKFSPAFTESTDIKPVYEAALRLIDLLSRGGFDGVTMPVHPGHLELLFRLFDREELTLIPAVEFNRPIRPLEKILDEHPELTAELLISNPKDTLNRRYNLLHPVVQQAMGQIVSDLTDHFGHHPSFGGVSVILSPESYAQLPFALYVPDDYTFALFRQETAADNLPFPDEEQLRQTVSSEQFLLQKNNQRLRFLQSSPKVWETWVRWRAAKVSGFYAGLACQTATKKPAAKLYLLGGKMFDAPEIRQFCTPALPKTPSSLQTLQLLGFDLNMLMKIESLVFLKPVQFTDTKNTASAYRGLDTAENTPLFSKNGMVSGVQFYDKAEEQRMTGDFAAMSGGVQERKRFVRQLAQGDVLAFFEGGDFLTLGSESALYDVLSAYRQLPPSAFHTFQSPERNGHPPKSLQPLVIRYKNTADSLVVYLINDAPFEAEAELVFSAAAKCVLTELTGRRMIRSFTPNVPWRVPLLPYDLIAVRIDDPHAEIISAAVRLPQTVCGGSGLLKQKIDDMKLRIQAVRSGIAADKLLNAGFELGSDAGTPDHWESYGKTFSAQLDPQTAETGQRSVRLTNTGGEKGALLSLPMDLPPTGRLGVSMNAGIPENCRSLNLNIILQAKDGDRIFFRSCPVGETLRTAAEKSVPKNGVKRHQLIVPFERLPLTLQKIQIGMELLESGTVWIDDVVLYPVLFSPAELTELQKMLVVADQRCQAGRVSDLITLLEGDWAQFLFRHVPAAEQKEPVSVLLPEKQETAKPETSSPTWFQRARSILTFGRSAN